MTPMALPGILRGGSVPSAEVAFAVAETRESLGLNESKLELSEGVLP